nr:MAG TPA: hypothetical protein [Caudoviricetes sp.]
MQCNETNTTNYNYLRCLLEGRVPSSKVISQVYCSSE